MFVGVSGLKLQTVRNVFKSFSVVFCRILISMTKTYLMTSDKI